MNYPNFFETKNSLKLIGLEKEFNFLFHLYSKKKLPNVLMLDGKKGIGKSTLINHFLYSIFDSKNYNKKEYTYSNSSSFYEQFRIGIFSNIIYLDGSEFQSIKVEDIRNLKKKIFQTTILNKDRFIIFDDIELFNQNSLNALLKIIEEPIKNNYFFLINNNSKKLLETIRSRCLEIKIILKESQRYNIIENLINLFNLNTIFDPKISQLTPGNFVKFSYICNEYNITLKNDFITNLSLILNLYKKNKDILFINLAFFLANNYFNPLNIKDSLKKGQIYELRNFILNNLNNFVLYNINQNTLLNALNSKINNE
tara:strand:- start:173 stop:1108 length:936 start_codon:yes stop_codon:yes gene_type:complete